MLALPTIIFGRISMLGMIVFRVRVSFVLGCGLVLENTSSIIRPFCSRGRQKAITF